MDGVSSMEGKRGRGWELGQALWPGFCKASTSTGEAGELGLPLAGKHGGRSRKGLCSARTRVSAFLFQTRNICVYLARKPQPEPLPSSRSPWWSREHLWQLREEDSGTYSLGMRLQAEGFPIWKGNPRQL